MPNFFKSVLNGAEDIGARLPIVGDLLGLQTDEEKRLLAKQRQMAAEAKQRLGRLSQGGMQGTAQSLLAFNPMNQMMAQQFGPQAAFAPGQFADMVQNPMGPPQIDPALLNYEAAEQKRREMLLQGITPPGEGPAPLEARQPAPARRY